MLPWRSSFSQHQMLPRSSSTALAINALWAFCVTVVWHRLLHFVVQVFTCADHTSRRHHLPDHAGHCARCQLDSEGCGIFRHPRFHLEGKLLLFSMICGSVQHVWCEGMCESVCVCVCVCAYEFVPLYRQSTSRARTMSHALTMRVSVIPETRMTRFGQ